MGAWGVYLNSCCEISKMYGKKFGVLAHVADLPNSLLSRGNEGHFNDLAYRARTVRQQIFHYRGAIRIRRPGHPQQQHFSNLPYAVATV